MLRRVSSSMVFVACLLGLALPARAEAPVEPPQPSAPAEKPRAPEEPVKRFSLLASVAYGTSTQNVLRVHLEPYAAMVGAEPGYTFTGGLYLGAYVHYGMGHEVSGHHGGDARLEREYDYVGKSSTLSAGATVGYDLPLYMFVLRYTLHFGFTRMSWDFGDVPALPVGEFSPEKGTKFGFQLAPGLALLWHWQLLECGLGFDYMIQSADYIPAGVLGKLLLGVRL
jgi:hypothetical protein